jgi:hypothetical protein
MPKSVARTTYRTLLFLLSVLVVLLPEAAYAQQQIKVGAWNIQYLGAHNCRPVSTQHTAQRPSDIAKFIIASGVDILGLEEITDDDASVKHLHQSDVDQRHDKNPRNDWRHLGLHAVSQIPGGPGL